MTPSLTDIDACLPQTQCTLCGYEGCLPYAQAIEKGQANIAQCAPGELNTLHQLAKLTHTDPTPFESEVQARYKPPTRYWIEEKDCIGCTKCIQACPVGAITGVAKQLHQIIGSECTGCDLCVPACPVDCIRSEETPRQNTASADAAQRLYRSRTQWLKQLRADQLTQRAQAHKHAKNHLKQLLSDAQYHA